MAAVATSEKISILENGSWTSGTCGESEHLVHGPLIVGVSPAVGSLYLTGEFYGVVSSQPLQLGDLAPVRF
jgi:hypothetical protein